LFYGGNNGFSIKICRYTMHQRLLFKWNRCASIRKLLGEEEMQCMVSAPLTLVNNRTEWKFEKKIQQPLGEHCLSVNLVFGNLVAFSTLTSHKLEIAPKKEMRSLVAAGFPQQ
jgi:hypothetical protein